MKHRSRDKNLRLPSDPRVRTSRHNVKRSYLPPRVEPAGSVFARTKALGGSGKDALNGSGLL